MANSDQEIARAIVVRRFQEICAAYDASLQTQKYHADQAQAEIEKQAALVAVANDCHAAARLIGFDLIAALGTFNQQQANATIHSPPPQQVIAVPKPIADVVLDLAQSAYPEPVRAKTLQEAIENDRGPLHYKTIGMTLYRLSKEGKVRRQGQKDWFFVPPEERKKNSGVGAPENADDLGL